MRTGFAVGEGYGAESSLKVGGGIGVGIGPSFGVGELVVECLVGGASGLRRPGGTSIISRNGGGGTPCPPQESAALAVTIIPVGLAVGVTTQGGKKKKKAEELP